MSEPLNNDEELESIKDFFNTEWHGLDSLSQQMQREGKRLIATVELQKSDFGLGSALVRKIQTVKEENAKLKAALEAALQRIEEMELDLKI